MAVRPDRLAGLPRAPAGAAAVLALALAAPALGRAGLLVPGATPDAAARLVLRVGGLAVAAGAAVALVRRPDTGWKGAALAVGIAGAVGTTLALLTLPVSDVALDWPPPPDADPLPPSPPPPAGDAAFPPPVLRLPAGGQLEVQADELILEFPDGSSYPFGSATGGAGATALPAGPSLELEVQPGGGVAVTDGAGTVLAEVPPGGEGFDLGDVSIQGDAGNRLVDVDDGTVTDAGGAASGDVEVTAPPADPAGRDLVATVGGVLLAVVTYWMIFLHGRLLPQRRRPSAPDEAEAVLSVPPADPGMARDGLVATLDGLLADPDPATAIVAAYARLLTALDRAGLGRRPQEAPHEHLRRALQPLGVDPTPVHDLADLFVLARFGDAPLSDAHRDAAIAALRHAVSDLGAPVPA